MRDGESTDADSGDLDRDPDPDLAADDDGPHVAAPDREANLRILIGVLEQFSVDERGAGSVALVWKPVTDRTASHDGTDGGQWSFDLPRYELPRPESRLRDEPPVDHDTVVDRPLRSEERPSCSTVPIGRHRRGLRRARR